MAEQTIRDLFLFHIAQIFTILLIVFIITIMGKKILLLLVESSNVFRWSCFYVAVVVLSVFFADFGL